VYSKSINGTLEQHHTMFAFKKFSFFQQVEVKLHGFPPNSTCHCEGSQQMFVGCDNGSIHVLDETYQSQGSFSAFGHKVLYMAYVQVRGGVMASAYAQRASDNLRCSTSLRQYGEFG
jgi:hypothetical protein